MRVLLTGICGFVGSHIVEHIQANTDWEIEGLATFRHMGDSIRTDAFKPGVRMHTCDVASPISDRLIDRIGPVDFIINAASQSHVDRSIADPRPFIENNVGIAISMLEYARVVKPKVFIQVSTDEVYGPAPSGIDFSEWHTMLPSNPYSASKACQEMIAISYWRTYGVPLVITNTMNMFGERQDAEKFVPMVIKRIATGKLVDIHGSDDYIGSRSYLHARNHADALLHLLGREPTMFGPDSPVPDRFNVSGDQEMNNLEMAQAIARIVGRPLQWRFSDFHATRPGHDLRYALDGTKIADDGWRAPLGLGESLQRTVNWTLAHKEWMA